MHKAIIACLAFAVLSSPLHAESAGSAALTGAAKGAGEGGGGSVGGNQPVTQNKAKAADKVFDQWDNYIRQMKPTKTTKPVTSGSQQQTGRE
jgi:hypothetical protein